MEKDQAQLIASTLGLTGLEEKHLAQLIRSMASAQELATKLPKDLHWSEEIAPVFRLDRPGAKP